MGTAKHLPLWQLVGLFIPVVALVLVVAIFIAGLVKVTLGSGRTSPSGPEVTAQAGADAGG
jgi:hypothetical protein